MVIRVEISNRAVYTFLLVMGLILLGTGVYAVTNPGHSGDEIEVTTALCTAITGHGCGSDTDTQDISISGHTISLTNGGSVTVPDNVDDADASTSNEIQTISISGHTISLNSGGGSVTVPDNYEANTVRTLQTAVYSDVFTEAFTTASSTEKEYYECGGFTPAYTSSACNCYKNPGFGCPSDWDATSGKDDDGWYSNCHLTCKYDHELLGYLVEDANEAA